MKNVLGKNTLLVMLSAWSLTLAAQEHGVSVVNPYNYPELADSVMPQAGEPGDGGGSGDESPAINRAVLNDMNVSLEITPETTDLMGERIDLSSGTVGFSATDVSIPGNSSIPVEITRSFINSNLTFKNTAEFGDWGLDLPHIHNSLFYGFGGLQAPWGLGKECTSMGQQVPQAFWYQSSMTMIEPSQYWSGLSLNAGGKTEKLLDATDGSISYTTKSNWKLTCYARTGGGEGFKAQSPQGVTYYLDVPHMVREVMQSYPAAPLYNVYLRVSRIEDRFGNWVNFQYTTRVASNGVQSNNLTKISSQDGRTIDLYYQHSTQPYLVTSVVANGKTWTYSYKTTTGYSLETVTLPDSSAWTYDLWALASFKPLSDDIDTNACLYNNGVLATGSITHPKGAKGTFTLRSTKHGNTETPMTPSGAGYAEPACSYLMSLTNKTLTGPGISMAWAYSYSQNNGSYKGSTKYGPGISVSGYDSGDLKTTTVVAPDGSKTVHVFNRRWDYSAGTEVATLNYDTDGVTLLQNTVNTYTKQTPSVGGLYVPVTNLEALSYRALLQSTTSAVTTDTYYKEFQSYNTYGMPLLTKESNSINVGWVRYTRQGYTQDTALNILNLPTTTELSSNGSSYTNVKQVQYYPASASAGKWLPQYVYAFGALQQTYSYNADGSLAQQTDNIANRWVKFSNYHRGKARTIELPGRYSLTPGLFAYRTINDDGTVASVTDFNGNTTSYGYDPVGRVTLVDPANATWANTNISYTVPGGSYALQQSISRGNYRKVVSLDALMRPVLTQEWDAADSSTTRYVNQRFNAYNKAVFSSVPSISSSETVGSSTIYDGLQRVKQQTNTTEGDVSFRYLNGNQVEKTDGRGFITTTAYLAYGSPEQSLATTITQPDSVSTSLSYNLFNNPTSIVQGGVTESRIYNAQQQLCLQKRLDTGITVYEYNAVGQLTRMAEGMSVAAAPNNNPTLCSHYVDSTSGQSWITTTYDNIGDIYTQSYADGSPAKTYTLDGQGNVKRLSSGTVVWDYEYNSQHLIEKEILTVDNQSFILDPAYNSMGYQTSQTYPSGTLVNYAPNALGQPTQAGSYASNATYHPNGQLKSFTYGNGLTFTQNLDTDYRPYERLVKSGSTLRVGQRYGYDGSENLQNISDLMNSSKNVSLGFDGLNRLTSASGYWGSGSLSYDTLGNIKTKTLGSQALTYSYDTNNRLTTVTGGYSFSYDGRGAVTHNGKRSFTMNRANQITGSGGISYVYDGYNRRVKKVNGSNVQYSLYNQSGQFLSTTGTKGPTEHIYLGSQLVARVSQVATTDDKPGYTGHLEDKDIGLTYMQARYYDPVIGRFYSNDPVDTLSHLNSPNSTHGFNRYAYANNNPYKYTDPTGMTSWPVDKNQNGQVVVTSQFGPRNTGINGASKNHSGTDFRAGKGADIKATENGTVAAISESKTAGNSILISNNDGSMSGHAHTKASEGIKVGDKVSEGSVVGKSDGSGTGNAPHQHYTYRPGTPSNPATTSTPKVDPMKTQFKDMPQKEVCIKGSGSC